MARSRKPHSRKPRTSNDVNKNEKEFVKDDKDSSSKPRTVGKHVTRRNDEGWYLQDPVLARDSARISFNYPTGSPVSWEAAATVSRINGNNPTSYIMPGVARLPFALTYGIARSETDPINIESLIIFNDMRKTNTGTFNYNAQDVMLYLMAMDNIYMYYQKMCRIYGVMNLTSQLNRHLPRTLAKALKFDYDDIQNNLANFKYYINTIGPKLNALCVPAIFSLYTRHMWMCSGIYQDAPTQKSQFYVFDPVFVGVYDEKTSTTGGALNPRQIDTDDTFAKMVTTMDTLISAVVNSEDCNRISADIRKRYGDGGLFSIMQIDDNYMTIPTYREDVLRQIHNATVFDGCAYPIIDGTTRMLYQDINANILLSGIKFYVSSGVYEGNRIIVGSDEVPSEGEVLEDTRFTVSGKCDFSATGTSATVPGVIEFAPNAVGTEVIIGLEVYNRPTLWDGSGFTRDKSVLSYNHIYKYGTGTGNMYDNLLDYADAYAQLEPFNYHPRVGTSRYTVDSDFIIDSELIWFNQEIGNFTTVDEDVLFNLHNTVLMSLFNIPK